VTKFITFDLAMLTSMTSFRNHLIFGKVQSAVTSFLNYSRLIGRPTFTGISSNRWSSLPIIIGSGNIYPVLHDPVVLSTHLPNIPFFCITSQKECY